MLITGFLRTWTIPNLEHNIDGAILIHQAAAFTADIHYNLLFCEE